MKVVTPAVPPTIVVREGWGVGEKGVPGFGVSTHVWPVWLLELVVAAPQGTPSLLSRTTTFEPPWGEHPSLSTTDKHPLELSDSASFSVHLAGVPWL